MPNISAEHLTPFVSDIFEARAVPKPVARQVATSLVLSNLKGHDSHGVIRVAPYLDWLSRGWINPEAELEVLVDEPPVLMTDGQYGFGQSIGRQATRLAITRARQTGVCVLTLRRSGHLGRVGEFGEMAAAAGIVLFSLTNVHGGGILVAPHAGSDRRLSANPLTAAAPMEGGEPMVMDIATSGIAEGKLKVARARGEQVPPGLILNAQGRSSTLPEEFYADPPGALLPMAEHKGFALSLFAEVLAGALSGGSCSGPGQRRVANNWFALFLDPGRFSGKEHFNRECSRLRDWVTASPVREGFSEVLMPGEPESRTEKERARTGIPIEAETWAGLVEIASRLQVRIPPTESAG